MAKARAKHHPLMKYIDELVALLESMVPRAFNEFDAVAIHQSRVATRRLTAAIDVFEPISTRGPRKQLDRALHKLRRRLGPLRDGHMLLEHLNELKQPKLVPAVDWLRGCFSDRQKSHRESVSRKNDVKKIIDRLKAWTALREDWIEATDGLHGLVSESLHLQLDKFVEHANAMAGMAGAIATTAMLDPHGLRIAGKSLRYTLELGVATGNRLPASVARSFKKMQNALGQWHDHVILAEAILKQCLASGLAHDNSGAQSISLDVAKIAIRHSHHHLMKFNSIWRDQGVLLASTIRQAFPLTEAVEAVPVIAPQTDPYLPGLEVSAVDVPVESVPPDEPSTV